MSENTMENPSSLYCLLDLGIKIEKEDRDFYDFVFTYQRNYFRSETFEKRAQSKKVISDISKLEEFSLQVRSDVCDPEIEYLSLFLNPNPSFQIYSSNQKQRIISLAFETLTYNQELYDELNINDYNEENWVTDDRNEVQLLYYRLKQAHAEKTIFADDLTYLQHDKLRPILRPYQLKAVKWMIDRETIPSTVDIPLIELKSEKLPHMIFYMDRFTSCIYDAHPGMRKIPAGGLLCDEMGLGKTVEMLSLILHRARLEGFHPNGTPVDKDYGKTLSVSANNAKTIKLHCICLEKNRKMATILCNSCKTRQHLTCVLKAAEFKETFDEYQCPDCWKKSGQIIESKATLIVSPLSIKRQWYTEIKRHIKDPNFRVFSYEGVKKTGWISPKELATYDVVLTDYNVLTTEIYFTKVNEYSIRRPSLCAKPVSPLPMIKWYRTCLDEAQMVEVPTNQCARMVNSLPAINRWAVTGTPIERDISTLYGLVYFLGYDPFTSSNVWKHYVELYLSGNFVPLIRILQKVMWRTCKIDVLDEIGIPPQSEVVHYVQMSDLQVFFYRSEHAKFKQIFNEKAVKVLKYMTSSRISAQTMKILMEPLRKLRQDCTVPSVFSKTRDDQMAQKKLLSPVELHEHMIKNTEVEMKTCLRTISSSLNGIAACQIMQKNFPSAITSYQNVLKLASEYHDKKIHVDTLLQIHAVHNMLDISKYLSDENFDKEQYLKKLAELEWKYIETYKNKVKEVEDRLKSVKNVMKELDVKELSNKGNAWWRQVLYESLEQKLDDVLVQKIKLDLKDFGMDFTPQNVRGTDLYLTTWVDKVSMARNKVLKSFKDLEYFHGNLKPKSQLSEDELFKIDYLVQSAYQCHLFVPELDSDDSDSEESRAKAQPKRTCQLCRTKTSLMEYECLIFNRYQWNENELRGSWNPCEQEYVFRTILSYSKRSNFDQDVISIGETEMKLIDSFKNEFKELSQYWVEINYTVSAYDELNMCKSRLEAVDMDDCNEINYDQRKNNMRIPHHMVVEIQHEMETEKSNAELNFVRVKGRLKYLEHLKVQNQLENCPICKQIPEEKYVVLQCGHSLCFICVTQMAKFQRNRLSCALCRHTQQFRDVFYVTLTPNESQVTGNFSAKIVRIIKEIFRIKREDPDVKIVIFSHWDHILHFIADALRQNEITFTMHAYNHRYIDQIQEFKTNSHTCLLLPLAAGSKGLNLTEATHVFLVEPILNPSEELQAIGRVHRIGQTRPTFVHRFIMKNTIEETIFKTVSNDKSGVWRSKEITIEDLQKLFELESDHQIEIPEPMEVE
uniref:CSON001404 protein n=1 Tax=Culicoides sonorensis TaxID=179676 RepID=A0A336MKX4_CULSO